MLFVEWVLKHCLFYKSFCAKGKTYLFVTAFVWFLFFFVLLWALRNCVFSTLWHFIDQIKKKIQSQMNENSQLLQYSRATDNDFQLIIIISIWIQAKEAVDFWKFLWQTLSVMGEILLLLWIKGKSSCFVTTMEKYSQLVFREVDVECFDLSFVAVPQNYATCVFF